MTRRRRETTFLFAAAVATFPGPPAPDTHNPLFGKTHLLPSPFTLHGGRLVYGTDVAYGITDFLQVGTNLVADFYGVYNGNAKVSLVDLPEFAFGLRVGYQNYNLHDVSPTNPDVHVTSWLPGATAAIELVPDLALFVGGNLNLTQAVIPTDTPLATSGFLRGAEVGSDLSWAYAPNRKGGIGNVLSAGVTYDLTYAIFGFGVSHHWPGFHVGIHYYPNATQYRVLPILAGGGSVDL